ncbi:hypothetical protein JYU34_000059 [Plutella xylostella]|uniref:Carboxylic ester hydrolase n=1 Tax=Plutella xylostella TaxID=51655 RepID=A0ABQ7R6Q2_PLUXY|nr:hypothetical protein JYU34_000059 [Plutella xylostella]
MWKLISLVICSIVFATGDEAGPVVSTALGDLGGFFMKTRDGRKIAAFTSVPFAAPPLGDLRFKAPAPAAPWTGVRDATQPSPPCVQRNPYTRQQEIVGQEDCLYLNLYTPRVDDLGTPSISSGLLPVMVWFHGGGWMCGDSSTAMYGPEFLLDRDVLLVATNYRLGPLGFLSTQDEACPGNNGLKDQQAALRWVQQNIRQFGGDPDSVTLFGESAGGASVHYHMISTTSAGLFHKAISESGTALVPWAEAPPGEALRNAFRLAKFMECPQAPSELMINCLRGKDAREMIDTEYRFYAWDYEPMTPFKAVVEPDLPGAFLTSSPRLTPAAAAVPWLTGLNKDEGCLKSVWITENSTRLREFLSAFDVISPVTFYYENHPQQQEITAALRKEYLDTKDEKEIKRNILKAYSDSYFNFPMVDAVDLVLQYTRQPVYLYELTYRATNSFSQIFGDEDGDHGVCHADELMHLFPIHFLSQPFSEKDIEISNLIITMFTNFATTGNPNLPTKLPVEWNPVSDSKTMEYLDIGHNLAMGRGLAESSKLWGSLPLWFNRNTRRFYDEL